MPKASRFMMFLLLLLLFLMMLLFLQLGIFLLLQRHGRVLGHGRHGGQRGPARRILHLA